MNVQVIDLVSSVTLAAVTMWVVYIILSNYMDVAQDFRQQQLRAGDASLGELYLGMSPETFFIVRLLLVAFLGFVGFVIGGVVLAVLFGSFGYGIPAVYLAKLRRDRVHQIELQLVEGLELLGNSLRSGLTLPQATELLVREFPPPISQEFALVLAESRLGVDFTDALENMSKRLNSTIVGILASGVSITKRCGGDLTQIFGNIAQAIRERAVIEGKLNAVTAQGRFQGLILGLMPFALVVILYFIDRDHVVTLFSYTLGIWAFTAVCIMVILAQLWIRKLMDIDV